MSRSSRGRLKGMSTESSKTVSDSIEFSPSEHKTVEMFPQWALLQQDQIIVLLGLSVDQIQLQFEDILGLKKHQTCLKEAAVLDYFVAGFWWAKEMNFTYQQISFMMAILQLLLDNIKDKQMGFAENFSVFTQNLLTSRKPLHTDVNPLFDLDQIKSITDYFKSSLFQHYKLYQLLFTHQRDERLLRMERSIEVVNSDDFAAPLEEGIPAEVYFRYIAPSPATPPPQSFDECLEKNEEAPSASIPEGNKDFSMEDVREVLGEVTKEMLEKLQADFTEKLQIQEEFYTSRLDSLKRVASK